MSVPASLETILASDRLPSLPEVAFRVLEIARRPDPDFQELSEAIRLDPAIAGRVLRTANSALLGMKTRATSIEAAVPRLGTTMVRALVLGFCLADSQKGNSLALRPWYQRLWRESLYQAAAAEALAEREQGRVDPGNWFLAGLLQDIGRLAMLNVCGEDYVEHVLDVPTGLTQVELEQRHYGFNHIDVSIALCQRWNLDEAIIQAITSHHAAAHRIVPLRFISSTSLVAGLITASHIAEYLEDVGHNLSRSRQNFERLLMQVFALPANDIFRLLADIDTRVGEIAATFAVDIGHTHSLEAILAEAQALLSQIAVNSQLRLVNAHLRPEPADSGRVRPAASGQTPTAAIDPRWQDGLTHTFSRAWLEQALHPTLVQAYEQQLPVGLLLFGLGASGQPAQTGRGAGSGEAESVLVQTAELLRQSVRLSDSVVRWSPQEFAILMTDINVDMLYLTADQLRRRFLRTTAGSATTPATGCRVAAVLCPPSSARPAAAGLLLKTAERLLAETRGSEQSPVDIFCLEDGRATRAQFSLPGSSPEPAPHLTGTPA